jgi:hypothetical protein
LAKAIKEHDAAQILKHRRFRRSPRAAIQQIAADLAISGFAGFSK